MSSSSSESDFSSSNGSEDAKMKAMLAEWDDKDSDNEQFADSESESESSDAEKKMALLRSEVESSESEEEEEASEEEEEEESEEESEEEEEEEELVAEESSEEEEEESEEEEEEESEEGPEEEEESEEEALDETPDVAAVSTDDDASEEDVIDDGNIEDTLKKKPKNKKKQVKVEPITAITDDDNEEDIEMKQLLQEWGGDEGEDDNDDSDDDASDSDESEREVVLEDHVIDHVTLAAPDLEEAMAEFEKMTGIGAVIAGSINGLGIKTARISFNDSSYIEIIAPDPKQSGPIGQLLKTKGISELTPFHFAIRTSRCEELKEEVKKFGYVPDHITMFGGEKDGTPKKWELLFLYGHKIGGTCPYFVNWNNTTHPCAKLPVVGKLKKLTVRAPEDDPVHELLEHVNVRGFNVETGKTKLSFQFSSPEGTVKFATSKAVGFKFPGFDDEDEDIVEHDVDFETPEAPELLDVSDDEYEALPPPAY